MAEEQSKRFRLNSRDMAETIFEATLSGGAWVAASVVLDQYVEDGLANIPTDQGLTTFSWYLAALVLLSLFSKALRDPNKKNMRDVLTRVLGWVWKLLTRRKGDDSPDDSPDDKPSPRKKPVRRIIDRLLK